MHGDVEFSLLILNYDLPGALGGDGGGCLIFFFFLPMGPGGVLHMSAQSHGLRDQCSSCSFSSGRKCSRQRGLAVQWLHPLAPLQHLESSLPPLQREGQGDC